MDRTRNLRGTLGLCAVLIALTFAVFSPVLRHDFVNYDDPDYVVENPHVLGGLNSENVWWAFQTPHAGNWHPVTWLSHMLDVSLFGLNAGRHHLISLALHASNAVLLFLLLQRLLSSRWTSAFIAAMFALHPLHVESVAWIAERKDVLSGFFFMLTLIAYSEYAKSIQYSVFSVQSMRRQDSNIQHSTPNIQRSRLGVGSWTFYILALILFGFGLMSKPMLVTLPFVLLLLDYWPLRRFDSQESSGMLSGSKAFRLLLEKAPFFILSLLSSVVTFLVQRNAGAMTSIETLPPSFRISNALVAYFRYLEKTFWPVNLSVFYPLPKAWPIAMVALSAGLMVIVSVLVIRSSKRCPYLTVGWFWFLGMLVPVIGLLQVGRQSMADRYMYLPMIGVTLAVGWGGYEIASRWPSAKVAIGSAAALAIAACAFATQIQAAYWTNSLTLFEHALAVTRDNAVAHNNLGTVYLNQKETKRAEEHFAAAVQINPRYPEALVNLAICREEKQDTEAARDLFEQSLAVQETPAGHYNLANLLSAAGEMESAEQHYLAALRLKPEMAEAIYNLGALKAKQGKAEEALGDYEQALRLKPGLKDVHLNTGALLASQKRWDEAIGHFQMAIRNEPNNADVRFNLAAALEAKGDNRDAIAQFGESVRLRPDDAEARQHVGFLLLSQGLAEEAIPHLQALLKLRATAQTHYYLALALDAVGRYQEAVEQYREAVPTSARSRELSKRSGLDSGDLSARSSAQRRGSYKTRRAGLLPGRKSRASVLGNA